MPSTMIDPHLEAITRIVADWVDDVPGIPVVFIFGSRVRGDHQEGSDVDIRFFVQDFEGDEVTTDWWCSQVDNDFADLRERLPCKLDPIYGLPEKFDDMIRAAAGIPVYQDRKAVCVWTPRARNNPASDRAGPALEG